MADEKNIRRALLIAGKKARNELLKGKPGYDPKRDTFLRFGDIPKGERSKNWITGGREKGVSVYALNHKGAIIRPAGDIGEASARLVESLGKGETVMGEKTPPLPRKLVQGRRVGTGEDEEPIIRGVTEVPVAWHQPQRGTQANYGPRAKLQPDPPPPLEPYADQFAKGGTVHHDVGSPERKQAFEQWGGSPERWYHGTSKDVDFSKFKVGRHGAWFTRNPDTASMYAEQNDSQGYKHGHDETGRLTFLRTNTRSRVIPVHLKFGKAHTGQLPDDVMGAQNYKRAQSDWFDRLRAQGYDSWVPEGGDVAVILKDPANIKSAIGNVGTFDPKNADIGKANGGPIDAYHGSPHDFDKFDFSKIGTGEGAQVYGKGIYLAEEPSVANSYRKGAVPQTDEELGVENAKNYYETRRKGMVKPTLVNNEFKFIKHPPMSHEEAIKSIYDDLTLDPEKARIHRHTINALKAFEAAGEWPKRVTGHLYDVRFHADPEKLIDLDKPTLGEQTPHVQRGIKDAIDMMPQSVKEMTSFAPMRDRNTRSDAAIKNAMTFADERRLAMTGVPGNKYFDQYSRGSGKGTRNYVVFPTDKEILEITRKRAEGGAVDQEITSADTSIKQVPALFKSPHFETRPGQRNLDIGGGKFDLGTEHLAKEHGVESHVYDPFNRSEEHNASVLKKFARKKADSVTAANVLNVIQHPHHRKAVIQQAHDNLHPSGKAYFGIYEGNGSGKGAQTSKGWQNNRKAAGYLDEVREVFPHVERKGNIIVAHKRAPRAHGGATKEVRRALMIARDQRALLRRVANIYPGPAGGMDPSPGGGGYAGPGGGKYIGPSNYAKGGEVPPMTLYPAAARLIKAKGQERATPQQYAALPGIKPDELKHSKFDVLGTEPIDRAKVHGHLIRNRIPLQETVLKGDDPESALARFGHREELVLPGGENHREILLHLPKTPNTAFDKALHDRNVAKMFAEDEERRFEFLKGRYGSEDQRTVDQENKMVMAHERLGDAQSHLDYVQEQHSPDFKESHYDTPNVLAHIRLSDRKGPNGEKILHVEEMQSDWAQKGRKKGFKTGAEPLTPAEEEEMIRLADRGSDHDEASYARLQELVKRNAIARQEEGRLPSGPYVDNTSKWTDLALKRVLHEAAHGNYDKVVFTPGEAQNDRYGLTNRVHSLHYSPDTNDLYFHDKDNDTHYVRENITPDKLPDYIGAELTDRLLKQQPVFNSAISNRLVFELKGNDLKIGGKGMKGYYDEIMPKRLQALAKQHDPNAKVQLNTHRLLPRKMLEGYDIDPADIMEHMGVEPHDWSTRWPAMSEDERTAAKGAYEQSGPTLHSLDVTPQMRDSIKTNGFSQFKRGGAVDENEGPIADWHWRPLEDVRNELQLDEIPSHVHKFGEFMDETARRAASQGLTPRDLIKAYAITRASIGRRALPVETLRQTFHELPKDVAGRVRPEGAMGHWLHTKMGQRYLDAAEAGRVDEEAIAHAQNAMRRFGKVETEPTALRWAAKNLPGMEGRVSELIARAHRGQSSPEEWRNEMRVPGVAASKAGFLASMLGRGDQPTLDARQIILHTGRPTKEAAPLLGRKGASEAAVNRLAGRQTALGFKHDKSMSPFYQHLAHHAIWDKTAGEETTHDDLMQALRGAKDGGRQGFSTGGKPEERPPAHYLVRAMLELFPHGFKDVPEPELRRMLRNPHTDVSPDTIKAVLHARPATHGLLHRASAVTGHDPEKLMQHLLPSGPGEPKRQGITDQRRRDIIERAMATIAPNASIETKRPKLLTPEDLFKMRAVTAAGMSDRSAAGHDVTGIGEVSFDKPISALGGVDYNMMPYTRKNKLAWASARNAITALGNAARDKAREVQKKHGIDAQPLLTTKIMGLQSLDQSHMVMKAATHLLHNAKISDADAEAFNEYVRQQRPSKKPPYMPDFPGIKHPDLYKYLMSKKMPQRTALIKAMDVAAWNKKGVPNPAPIRLAFTKPELISAPEGTPGAMFASIDAEDPHHTVDPAHPSYQMGVKGKNVGGLDRAVPKEAFHQDYFDQPEIKAKLAAGKTANVMSGYMKSPVTQYHDQKWLDRIMPIYEKSPAFKQAGGSVVDRALKIARKTNGR